MVHLIKFCLCFLYLFDSGHCKSLAPKYEELAQETSRRKWPGHCQNGRNGHQRCARPPNTMWKGNGKKPHLRAFHSFCLALFYSKCIFVRMYSQIPDALFRVQERKVGYTQIREWPWSGWLRQVFGKRRPPTRSRASIAVAARKWKAKLTCRLSEHVSTLLFFVLFLLFVICLQNYTQNQRL